MSMKLLYDENWKFLAEKIESPHNQSEIYTHLDLHLSRTRKILNDYILILLLALILSGLSLLMGGTGVVNICHSFIEYTLIIVDEDILLFIFSSILTIGGLLFSGFIVMFGMIGVLIVVHEMIFIIISPEKIYRQAFFHDPQHLSGKVMYVLNASGIQQIRFQYADPFTHRQMIAAFNTATSKDIDAGDKVCVLTDGKTCVLL